MNTNTNYKSIDARLDRLEAFLKSLEEGRNNKQ
jgi:hypothetical protein